MIISIELSKKPRPRTHGSEDLGREMRFGSNQIYLQGK